MGRPFGNKIMGRNADEIELFLQLVSRQIQYTEWGVGNPTTARTINYEKWRHAWSTIRGEFNASDKCTVKATLQDLYSFWSYLKSRMKLERRKPGATGPLGKRFAPKIEQILRNVKISGAAREQQGAPCRSPTEGSTESNKDSDAEAQDESVGSQNISRSCTRRTNVGNSLRRLYVSIIPDSDSPIKIPLPSVRKSQELTSVPRTSHDQGPNQSLRPYNPASIQLYRQIVSQPFGQSRSFAYRPTTTALRTVQPTPISRATLNPLFSRGEDTCQYLYTGALTSATGSSGSLNKAQHQLVAQPSPSARTSTSRTYQLHVTPSEALHENQHFHALSETLHISQMRTHGMLAHLTKELHAANMRCSAAKSEVKAIDDTLLKRNEELRLAKIRSEERTVEARKNLHDISMEAARSRYRQAEINKQIVEMKLQQAEMELQHLRTIGQSLLVFEDS